MAHRRLVVMLGLALFYPVAASAQNEAPYSAGVADRSTYENWFAGLSGGYKTGVDFWVYHRSLPGQDTCFANGMSRRSDWMYGCLAAQQRMSPWDVRRNSEPDYRLGWNSIQSPNVQAAVRARQAAMANSSSNTSSSGYNSALAGDVGARCAQEVSFAYKRGQVSSPAVAYQIQEGCMERYRQQAIQVAQQTREAQLRATAAQEATRRQNEQIAAEQSPDNNCRKPSFAKGLMDSFSGFDFYKNMGVKAMDIEHLTTVAWNTETMAVTCHGTFILSSGNNISGTIEMRPNIAGEMIVQWHADRS